MPTHSSLKANTEASFAQLGVAAEICDGLATRGITHPFAIQELTLPLALDGRDLIGQARTGMGKTYAFGAPLIDRVFDDAALPELNGRPHALIITPTRELAVQVAADLTTAAQFTPVTVAAIYGGQPIDPQIRKLHDGVDIVVGTPGRLLDLHSRGDLDLSEIGVLVLDEADEMLDLGFRPQIEKLLRALTNPHQAMLFSATMSGEVLSLARTFTNKAVNIRVEQATEATTHDKITQVAFLCHRLDRDDVVAKLLQARGREHCIIFTRTKRSAAALAGVLRERDFKVVAVHGDLNQSQREKALNQFRNGNVDTLVATDVAARGIDVDNVTHVINYQTPDDPKTYVHRIGRTGRAGRTGMAITLVDHEDYNRWQAINEELGLGLADIPEWFSTSPELLEAVDIPEDANTVNAPAPARRTRHRRAKR